MILNNSCSGVSLLILKTQVIFLADGLAQIQLLLGSKHMVKAGVKVKSIIVLGLHSRI